MCRLLLAFALCFALRCGARAQDDPPFGERGQWMIDGSVGISMRSRKWEQKPNANPRLLGLDELSLWVSPTARLFVAKDLAVGANLRFGIERDERQDGIEFDANSFGAGGLLAYRVGLGMHAFLLPELGVGAVYVDRSVHGVPDGVFGRGSGLSPELFQMLRNQALGWQSATLLHASLSIPLAFVVAPRFYVGGGLFARVVHAADGVATPRGDDWDITIGLATTFGTWL
jgi:hypothetical protein